MRQHEESLNNKEVSTHTTQIFPGISNQTRLTGFFLANVEMFANFLLEQEVLFMLAFHTKYER